MCIFILIDALFNNVKILAEVKLFVFLFVIKLFLNCSCSIDVSYCFSHLLCVFLFFFAICSLCVKIFICCRVCRRDRYWDNEHSQEVMSR